jgi:hypothetical protein
MKNALKMFASNPKLLEFASKGLASNPKLLEQAKGLASNPTELLGKVQGLASNPAELLQGVASTELAKTNTPTFSQEDINKIKQIIQDVIKEKLSAPSPDNPNSSIIVNKINKYIDKLAIDENNINEVKTRLMNLIFENINLSAIPKQFKYSFLLKSLPSYRTIIDNIDFSNANIQLPWKQTLSEKLKNELLKQKGGEAQTEDGKIKNVFYDKICRLLDIDIPDSVVSQLFLDYIKDFHKLIPPEQATLIYKNMAEKTNEFIDQIFSSLDPEFARYLFIDLLTNDVDVINIIDKEFNQNNQSNQTNTKRILDVLEKALYELEKNTPLKKNGGKKRKKTKIRRQKKTSFTKRHYR